MIFSRFIKPSFKDPKPEVRIQAIAKLDPDLVADKQKLHELAFNDSESKVSLTALEKLESFPLWLKMSQIAVDLKIKKSALRKVIEILADTRSGLIDRSQRHSTIMETSDPSLIKFGLDNSELCGLTDSDVIKLLEKLKDESLSRQILLRTSSSQIQLSLIKQVDDLAQLYKLRKKPLHEDSKKWLARKVAELEAEKELPKQLQQGITLALSQLKALSETSDYAKIIAQKPLLEKKIVEENAQLRELDNPQSSINLEKLESISNRLQVVLDQLKPAYEQQQFLLKQSESFNVWQAHVKRIVDEANTVIEKAFTQEDEQQIDIARFDAELKNLKDQGEEHRALEPKRTSSLINKCDSTLNLMVDAPLLIQTAIQIQQAVDQFTSTYVLPENYHSVDQAKLVYNALVEQVESLLQNSKGQIPSSMLKAWSQTKHQWSTHLSKLKKDAGQQVNTVDKKIRAINGMVKQGRFKAAIAVFTKTKRMYEDLPVSMQSKVERAFQSVSHEVSELKDWQSYIAQPRKPELLTEVQALSKDNTDIDVAERSKDVNRLRKDWLSLGKFDTVEDDTLNKQFDEAIELAFAPCRQHYAHQQEERERNSVYASELLEKLKACEGIEDDLTFNRNYIATIKKWNNLGQIDKERWQALKSEFAKINKRLKQRQQNIQKANASAKKRLVKQAEAFAENITDDAVEGVKQLQSRWKSIGFAGKADDNRLWAAFKQANDQVFDNLRATKEASRQASQQVFNQMESQLNAFSKSLNDVNASQQLSVITSDLSELNQQLFEKLEKQQLTKSQFERLYRLAEQLKGKINSLQEQFRLSLAKQKIDEVFNYLHTRIGKSAILDDSAPKALLSLSDSRAADISREQATIRLEVLAGIDSPAQDKALRQQIQLEVMAKKMQSGEVDSSTALISSWLMAGAIPAEESALLERMEKAYKALETSITQSK